MLEVLAVDRVDDAVGANELDSTVDVDVYHRATLTVLGREKISRKAAMAHPTQTVPRAPPPPSQVGVGADRLKTRDGMGTRDSQLNACGGPHPGAPQSGPPASAVERMRQA